LIRYGAVLASLCISAGLGYIGVTSYRGAQNWAAYMQFSQAGHAIPALERNLAAYEAFPLEPAYRRQLSGTLVYVMARHSPQVVIDPAAADYAARIARTAGPDDTSVLLPRAEYLINSGRWQEPEMADIMARLSRVGAGLQTYWLLKAYWHAFTGEPEQMRRAIAHGMAMKPATVDLTRFTALTAALEKSQ
jgi:hypothetical protein